MKECSRMRTALLEAGPDELSGAGSSPLARHLATCASCRTAADAILRGTAALDRHLSSPGTGPDVDHILALASASGATRVPVALRLRRRLASRWRGPALAAAALVAALFLLPRGHTMDPVAVVPPSPPPLVESNDGRDLAVFPTADPEITVVWFF